MQQTVPAVAPSSATFAALKHSLFLHIIFTLDC